MQLRVLTVHNLLALALCLYPASGVHGQEFKPEPGFRVLFNGSDLSGWRYNKDDLNGKKETADQRFTVKDGAIVAEEGKGIRVLETTDEFNGPIILKMDFRAGAKADSGVYVRGPQLQVRDFIRRGEQKQLADVFKNDGWNELEIAVSPVSFVTTVNGKTLPPGASIELVMKDGKPVLKVNGQSTELASLSVAKEALAVCKINGVPFDPSYKPGSTGRIGLQAETGKFEFRRIRVKPLE
jgi:hypothetical protein